MSLPLLPLIGAFNFLKNSWLGKALAIAGGIFMALFLARRSGRKAAEAKQERINLEAHIETGKRANKAADAARAVGGDLSDDELHDKLRKTSRLRD